MANVAGICHREVNVATDLKKRAPQSWIMFKTWLKRPDDLCSVLGHSFCLASVSFLLLSYVPKEKSVPQLFTAKNIPIW